MGIALEFGAGEKRGVGVDIAEHAAPGGRARQDRWGLPTVVASTPMNGIVAYGAYLPYFRLDRKAIGEAGGTAWSFRLDVTERDACRQAAGKVGETIGDVSILVNNAGINRRNAFTAVISFHFTGLGGFRYCARKRQISALESFASFVSMRLKAWPPGAFS